MEIFTLLDELEDILDKSRNLPFSAKTVVNKEEILDLLKEIRLKLPDELKQAKWDNVFWLKHKKKQMI